MQLNSVCSLGHDGWLAGLDKVPRMVELPDPVCVAREDEAA